MPFILFLIILCSVCTGCSDEHPRNTANRNSHCLQEVLERLNGYSNSGEYEAFMEEAMPLYKQAVADDDRKSQVILGSGIAYIYARTDAGDSAVWYLDRLIPMAEKLKDRNSLVILYNTYGLYSLYYSVNYNDAVDYFIKALDNVKDTRNDDNYMRIINNLSHTYNLRSDTAGLRYSLEVYDAGIRRGDDHLKYIGAINTATQYGIRKDWNKAYSYIRTALELTDRFYSKVEVYSLYADILYHLGNNEEAEKYFRKALALKNGTEAAVMCGLYRNYGYFLLDNGRYEEAENMFRKGISIAINTKSYMYRHDLYLGLSIANGRLGDISGELANFKTFHYLSDSLFNAEKERSINELKVKYETEKVRHRLQIAYIAIFVLVIAISAICLLLILKRKRDKGQITRHYENFRREQGKKEAGDGGRLAELFGKIEDLMNNRQVWRENDISIETLAKYLNSNRSYISNAINKYAGVPFKQYINTFRISEAVAILSNPEDDTPLKAMYAQLGFNSSSSFYRSFQTATGVPPSQYRREVRNIQHGKMSQNDKI